MGIIKSVFENENAFKSTIYISFYNEFVSGLPPGGNVLPSRNSHSSSKLFFGKISSYNS